MSQQTPLIWLRTFAAAAKHCSFTRAAQELHITQAAVSKHMRALELHLGQVLFVRQAHGLQLTELGSRYRVEVEAALMNLDNATSDLHPEVVESAARNYEPHQVAYYVRELANDFHTYYNAHPFIAAEDDLRLARLSLIDATRIVLANALALLGVSAPERM